MQNETFYGNDVDLKMVRLTTMNPTIAVLFGSAGVSWSADLQKGWNVYRGGDYATALREWKPLAERKRGDRRRGGEIIQRRPQRFDR